MHSRPKSKSSMRRKHFIRCAVERIREMRDEGYEVRRLRGVADRFVKTYVTHASARKSIAAAMSLARFARYSCNLNAP